MYMHTYIHPHPLPTPPSCLLTHPCHLTQSTLRCPPIHNTNCPPPAVATCSYIGIAWKTLQFTFKLPEHYTSPAGGLFFTWLLLSLPPLLHTPRHRVAVPILVLHVLPYIFLCMMQNGSWEFVSTWTWFGFLTSVYYASFTMVFDYEDGLKRDGICCRGGGEGASTRDDRRL